MQKIERASDPNRFTEAELRARVAAYQKHAATPQGQREARAAADRIAAAKERHRGFCRFPELAGGTGTAPVRSSFERAFDFIR